MEDNRDYIREIEGLKRFIYRNYERIRNLEKENSELKEQVNQHIKFLDRNYEGWEDLWNFDAMLNERDERLYFGDDPYAKYNEFPRRELSQVKHRLNSMEERILEMESRETLLDFRIEELQGDLRDNSLDIEDIFKELREINARNF